MNISEAAVALGRKGGKSPSPAKADAARRNGLRRRRTDRKYYAWASNDQGASTDVVLPMSESRHSIRAFEDAARAQFGSGWTIHIMCVAIDGDGQSMIGEPREIKQFRIR